MKTFKIQQFQDIARSIIHSGRLSIAKINYKLSHYNSAFYGFSKRIGQNRRMKEMKARELKERIVQKLPVFLRRILHEIERRARNAGN